MKHECMMCNKICKSHGGLLRHMAKHSNITPCPVCGDSFSKTFLPCHINMVHNAEENCSKCHRAKKYRDGMCYGCWMSSCGKHMRCVVCNAEFIAHSGAAVVCTVCADERSKECKRRASKQY